MQLVIIDIEGHQVGVEPRNALRTVSTQLEVALLEREVREQSSKGIVTDEASPSLTEMVAYITDQSALKFPSCFACLPGMITEAQRLYKLLGLDMLHAFDLST